MGYNPFVVMLRLFTIRHWEPCKLTPCPFDMSPLILLMLLYFLTLQVYSFSLAALPNYHKYQQLKTRQISQCTVRSLGWVSWFLCLDSHKADVMVLASSYCQEALGTTCFQAHSGCWWNLVLSLEWQNQGHHFRSVKGLPQLLEPSLPSLHMCLYILEPEKVMI